MGERGSVSQRAPTKSSLLNLGVTVLHYPPCCFPFSPGYLGRKGGSAALSLLSSASGPLDPGCGEASSLMLTRPRARPAGWREPAAWTRSLAATVVSPPLLSLVGQFRVGAATPGPGPMSGPGTTVIRTERMGHILKIHLQLSPHYS